MGVLRNIHVLIRGMRIGADPTRLLRRTHVRVYVQTERGDWEVVGDDLRAAMERLDAELKETPSASASPIHVRTAAAGIA